MDDLTEIRECLDSLIIDCCVKTSKSEKQKIVNNSEIFLKCSQDEMHVSTQQKYVEGDDKLSESTKYSDGSESQLRGSCSSFSTSNVFERKQSHLQEFVAKLPSKKRKLTTLEKSSMDWERFKVEEDLNEELTVHNKGKDGFLNKQAFLQRCDVRTFEQECCFRLSNRKK